MTSELLVPDLTYQYIEIHQPSFIHHDLKLLEIYRQIEEIKCQRKHQQQIDLFYSMRVDQLIQDDEIFTNLDFHDKANGEIEVCLVAKMEIGGQMQFRLIELASFYDRDALNMFVETFYCLLENGYGY